MEPTASEGEVTPRGHPLSGRIHVWLKRLFVPGGSLSQRVMRGGFWVFALRIVDRLLRLARTIVLARLLAPEDFGLFGIALLAMSALETFSQTGFQPALVQKDDDIAPYLDTAWTVQALRGVALAVVLLAVAPYVAIFFATPAATGLVRVLGLSMLFRGFANIGVVYFQKELEFHKQFIYELSGTAVDLVVAIAATLLLKNAWALVFGLLAGSLVRMLVSYLVHPYRPALRFEAPRARELYSFGGWILGGSIVVFLATQGDDVFLGKVLGVGALGLYQMAFRLSTVMSSEIAGTISRVTFPAYSRLQGDVDRLGRAYLRTVKFTALVTTPLAGGLFVLGPEFTRIFLGASWVPMIPSLRILAIMGMTRAIVGTAGAIALAVGKPRWDFALNLVRVSTMAATIYPLTVLWGISGTAISTLAGICTTVPVWLHISTNETNNRAVDYLRALLPPLVGTLAMCGVILVFKSLVGPFHVVEFLGAVLVGILSYAALILGVVRKGTYQV